MKAARLSALAAPLLVVALSTASLTPAVAQDDTDYLLAPNELSAEDQFAVRRVISNLNHALDAADYPLYGSFFSEDGVFESDFGDAIGPEGVAQAMEKAAPFTQGKRHVAANHVISGEGDDAVVTTYLVVFERDKALEYVGSALNVDTMKRVDGRWQVMRHESTLDPATAAAMREAMGG